MASEVKIECPKCAWEPDGGAYWQCTCGHVWDTFSTAAHCPACGKQWEYTQCIPHRGGCFAMSPHLDWYKGLDRWLEEELASIRMSALSASASAAPAPSSDMPLLAPR